ncbi:hypothetical protein HK405_002031, partial [Cladochytrium tenue]
MAAVPAAVPSADRDDADSDDDLRPPSLTAAHMRRSPSPSSPSSPSWQPLPSLHPTAAPRRDPAVAAALRAIDAVYSLNPLSLALSHADAVPS